MTKEEAIKTLQWYVDDAGISWEDFTEAFDMALNALRPVTREQVEKVRGEWEWFDETVGTPIDGYERGPEGEEEKP